MFNIWGTNTRVVQPPPEAPGASSPISTANLNTNRSKIDSTPNTQQLLDVLEEYQRNSTALIRMCQSGLQGQAGPEGEVFDASPFLHPMHRLSRELETSTLEATTTTACSSKDELIDLDQNPLADTIDPALASSKTTALPAATRQRLMDISARFVGLNMKASRLRPPHPGSGSPTMSASAGAAPHPQRGLSYPQRDSLCYSPVSDLSASTPASAAACGPGESQDVKEKIQEAVRTRDAYWRSRIKGEFEVTQKKIETSLRNELERDFVQLVDKERGLTNQAIAEKERVQADNERMLSKIRELQEKLEFQDSEIEAGKVMINQFSKLMKDKASQVCQYCRRSGTLKLPPN